MTGEELDKEMAEITEKLKKRDAADQKKSEKEFRDAMAKDTAGHMMAAFRAVAEQLNDLQSQIDASNPMAPVIRAIGELSVKLTETEQRLTTLESGAHE